MRPSLGTHFVTSRRFIDTFTEGEGRFMHSQSGLVVCGGVWKLEEHEEKTIGCFTFPTPSDTSTSIWERSHTLANQRWTHSCTVLYCTALHCTVLHCTVVQVVLMRTNPEVTNNHLIVCLGVSSTLPVRAL